MCRGFMSSDEDEKKKLYQVNEDYLTTLNEVRNQLNLISISEAPGDNNVDNITSDILSSSPLKLQEELYECNVDYLENLNVIRRQLNLEEIKATEKTAESRESSSIEDLQLLYTPPKKKICIREEEKCVSILLKKASKNIRNLEDYVNPGSERSNISGSSEEKKEDDEFVEEVEEVITYISHNGSPSEQSSPVKEPTDTLLQQVKYEKKGSISSRSNLTEEEDPFYTLNVPSFKEKTLSIHPTVTVLSNEEKPSHSKHQCELNLDKEDSQKTWNMSVHISRWTNVINQELKVDKIFTETDSRKTKKKFNRIEELEKEKCEIFSTVNEKDHSPGKKFVELETLSSLNNMSHFRRKQTAETVDALSADTDEEAVNDSCHCFSFCFVRKSKNYFS